MRMMPTALITGASGFCAPHLARRLRREPGLRIVGTGRRPAPPPGGLYDLWIPAALDRPDDVGRLIAEIRPEWIFHLAGSTIGAPPDIYRDNLATGVNLLEAVRTLVPESRVLLVGSAAEYGPAKGDGVPAEESHPCRPTGAYGLSKHALTLAGLDAAQRLRLNVVVARPFNLVGAGVPAHLVVGAVLRRIREALRDGRASVETGRLDTRRDFLAVQDTADAYVRMIRGSRWGEVFNLCSGTAVSVREVIERLLAFSPRPIALTMDPALVRSHDVPVSFGSAEKARAAFGFAPSTPLDAALREAWDSTMREDAG